MLGLKCKKFRKLIINKKGITNLLAEAILAKSIFISKVFKEIYYEYFIAFGSDDYR
jgi:hypothetical protein